MSTIGNIKFQIPTFISESAHGMLNKFSRCETLFSAKISSILSKSNAAFISWKTKLAPEQHITAALKKPGSYWTKRAAVALGVSIGGAIVWSLNSGLSPVSCPEKMNMTVDVLRDHIYHVMEKKNARDAFDAAINAEKLALEDYNKTGKCLQDTPCLKFKFYSSRLLETLVSANHFHSEILEIVKKWATQGAHFEIESKNILLKFVEAGKYKEVFEAAQSFPNGIFLNMVLNALIEKDVFLIEIYDFVQLRILADPYYYGFGDISQRLTAKGIGGVPNQK